MTVLALLFWPLLTFHLQAESPARPDHFNDLFSHPKLCEKSPEQISKADALKDIETLRRLIERAYAGEKELKIVGRTLNNRLEAVQKVVSQSDQISVHDFLNALHENFRGIQDSNLAFRLHRADGRTEIRRARYHGQSYYSRVRFREDDDEAEAINPEVIGLPAGSFLDDCQQIRDVEKALQPFARVQDGRLRVEYRMVQKSERPIRRSACFFQAEGKDDVRREIPFERHKLNDPESKAGVDTKSDPEVPLVRPAPFEFSWLGSASYWPQQVAGLKDKKAIILDLRGRQGNWSLAARRFAESFLGEKFDTLHHDRLESEVSLQGGTNFEACNQNKLAKPLIDAYRAGYDDRITALWNPKKPEKLFRKFNRGITKQEDVWVAALEKDKPKPSVFPGWLLIITNRNCQGACEELVAYLAQKRKTIVIGENTYGSLNYGGVLEYILPHSRIRSLVPSERLRSNGKARLPKEGLGYAPHLNVTDQNPIPLARSLVSCLIDETCGYLKKELGLKN